LPPKSLRDAKSRRSSPELLHINGIGNGSRGGKTRSVAAKYRNPKTADEVWSGRGRMPLWLDAEIKAGKDREDFLIG
jgi:DNA-binding protein H-NS